MSIHKNYFVTVSHPHFSGELMKASADFYYCRGSSGAEDEPPSDPEVELISCTDESGTDIFDFLETWQIHELESELLAAMLSNEEDYTFDDDWFDYDRISNQGCPSEEDWNDYRN